jgi:hypothetical protein
MAFIDKREADWGDLSEYSKMYLFAKSGRAPNCFGFLSKFDRLQSKYKYLVLVCPSMSTLKCRNDKSSTNRYSFHVGQRAF